MIIFQLLTMEVSFSSEIQSEYRVDWNKYNVKSRANSFLKSL